MIVDKKQVAEFIRIYGIKEYTYNCISQVFQNLGFIVVSKVDDVLDYFGENFDLDSDSFVINNPPERIVYINDSLSDAVKCHTICKLLYLRNHKDSRFCSADDLMDAESFSVYTKYLLSAQQNENKLMSIIIKSGAYGIAIIVCVLSLITAVVSYFSSVNFMNAFEIMNSSSSDNPNRSTNYEAEFYNFDTLGTVSSLDSIATPDSYSENSDSLILDSYMEKDSDEDLTLESETSSELSTANELYYATKNGKKYHLSSCYYVKDKSKCIELTDKDLYGSSYEPCKKCIG